MQDYWNSVDTLVSGQSGIVVLVVYIVSAIALWKVFTKAGEAGGWAFVPIINAYKICKIADRNGLKFLLYFIPIVNIIYFVLVNIRLAKAYGKSTAFGIGLVLFPVIFVYILAFGNAQYIGPRGEKLD